MTQSEQMFTVTEYVRGAKGKIAVSFDNGFSCTVYRSEAAELSLAEGVSITEEQFRYLLQELIGKRAKKRALFLLTQMDRSERKLREKLKSNGYPDCCIDDAIEYVKHFHYLDDRRYAENYIRYGQEHMSRQQLVQKLVNKGIPQQIAREAAETEYSADEREQIRSLLEKRHYDPLTADEGEYRRTYAFLARRGFRSGDIAREMTLDTRS